MFKVSSLSANFQSFIPFLQTSQLEKLKMVTPFSSELLSTGGVQGIRTAFLETNENKSGKQYIIEIDPEIQGKIFGHVLQFMYSGTFQVSFINFSAILPPTILFCNERKLII